LAINGIKTVGLKHEEIIDLIKTSGDLLRLDYEYNLPPWRNYSKPRTLSIFFNFNFIKIAIHPPNSVRSQTVHIQLEKEGNSYGFTMRGGSHDEKSKVRPLIVTNIRAGGSADREGTLKIGDRILAINGINLFNATLNEAYCIMKQCKGLALFLVEYDSAIVGMYKNRETVKKTRKLI
jgi:glutamate receptor-interacting protein